MTRHDLKALWRRRGAQLLRYSGASAVATTTSLTVLGLLVGVGHLPAVLANVVATAVGTVPSFELNRRWVWRRRGGAAGLRQVVPFCALSAAGLALSTVAVRVASAVTAGSGDGWHTLAVEGANAAAYGSLWVLQFFVLDRVLFRTPATRTAPAAAPPVRPPRRNALAGRG